MLRLAGYVMARATGESALDQLLEQCRRNFRAAPRRFSFYDRMTYLHTSRPAWCVNDDLLTFFRGKEKLLREGTVVWAHLVQANSLLFRPGLLNCPGEVVYCLDRDAPNSLETLAPLAPQLFQLKGTQSADPALAAIAHHLTNEMTRVYGLPVPRTLSPLLPCAISTVFFDRKHLPGRQLNGSFFPIVLNWTAPYIAMPLPARYWPEELIALWRA